MTTIEIDVEGTKTSLFVDNGLFRELTKIKKGVQKKDKDRVMVVDGAEGSGKSVIAMQIAKVLDPDFCLSRVTFTPEEFAKAVTQSKKGQCVIFDEAFTGLSARSSLTEVNRLLVALMMEMRQKNLFVIIVMPTFFMLDKYVALFRAKDLFHVYTKQGKRGRWCHFNNKQKKLLYLKGKQFYNYSWPRSHFRGQFFNKYVVSEGEYRAKKDKNLAKRSRKASSAIWLKQRNIMVYILYKEFGMDATSISRTAQKHGLRLERSGLGKIIRKIDKEEAPTKIHKTIDESKAPLAIIS